MQMSGMLEKQVDILVLMAINVLFSTVPYKTLQKCYKSIGLELNGLFKRNAATFIFDLGYSALKTHEIRSRLSLGEHILYI